MNTGYIDPAGRQALMKTSSPHHYDNKIQRESEADDVSTDFAGALMKALNKVNDLQVDSERLGEEMIYEPEKVDIHTVMIAQQKAELSLSFMKSVRDEAIRAYRELMNLR
jgi:flagellar hook-basal body complex protein FliE